MKKLIFSFLAFAAIASMAFRSIDADTFKVDNSASKFTWKGYKVTGEHAGTVNLQSGSLMMEAGKLVGGQFDIDMTSMVCTDLEGEWADKLMVHLKSAEFFGVATYGTSKLVIKKASPLDTKGNYKIVGDLTIKTTTKEVKFSCNVAENGNQVVATGKIVVDRSDFDVRYGSGSFFDGLGDKTIYDDFDLNFSLVANK